MMEIAICEDCPQDARRLLCGIQNYAEKNGMDCQCEIFPDGKALLEGWSKNRFSLVFLDIYLGRENGIEIAQKLRRKDAAVPLVFVTTSEDFALESYSVRALHYLIKPITERALCEVFARWSEVSQDHPRVLEVLSHRLPVFVPIDSILYIEIYEKLCTICCEQQTVETYATLEELETRIDDEDFLRTHRSYLVNLRHVKGTELNDFCIDNGKHVPMRRNGRAELRRKYMDYLLRKVRVL